MSYTLLEEVLFCYWYSVSNWVFQFHPILLKAPTNIIFLNIKKIRLYFSTLRGK